MKDGSPQETNMCFRNFTKCRISQNIAELPDSYQPVEATTPENIINPMMSSWEIEST